MIQLTTDSIDLDDPTELDDPIDLDDPNELFVNFSNRISNVAIH